DIDGEGVRDPKEPGMDGVKLFLDLDADGLLDANEPVPYPDVNGEYGFRGLDVIPQVAHAPAVLVGDASATPTGGASTTQTSAPTPSTVNSASSATFEFEGQLVSRAGLAFDGNDSVSSQPSEAPINLGGDSTVELRLRYVVPDQEPRPVLVLHQLDVERGAGYTLALDEATGGRGLGVPQG